VNLGLYRFSALYNVDGFYFALFRENPPSATESADLMWDSVFNLERKHDEAFPRAIQDRPPVSERSPTSYSGLYLDHDDMGCFRTWTSTFKFSRDASAFPTGMAVICGTYITLGSTVRLRNSILRDIGTPPLSSGLLRTLCVDIHLAMGHHALESLTA
jgi:hypothetical protein